MMSEQMYEMLTEINRNLYNYGRVRTRDEYMIGMIILSSARRHKIPFAKWVNVIIYCSYFVSIAISYVHLYMHPHWLIY